jgi:hypothetical protein
MQDDDKQAENTLSARDVIERFGGIRPAAKAIGVAFTTVQGWKERDHIPEHRWDELRKAAQEQGIDLGAETDAGKAAEPDTDRDGAGDILPPTPEGTASASPVEPEEAGETAPVENTEIVVSTSTDDDKNKAADTPWGSSAGDGGEKAGETPESEEPAESGNSEPVPEKKSRAGLYVVLIILVALGAAAGTWPQWRDSVRDEVERTAPELVSMLYPDAQPSTGSADSAPAEPEPAAQAPSVPVAEPETPAPAATPAEEDPEAVARAVEDVIAPLRSALDEARERIAELEKRPAVTGGGEGESVDLTPVIDRLTALEEKSEQPISADPAILDRLSAIEEKLATVRGADPATVAAISENLATVAARAEAMTGEIAQLRQQITEMRAARQSQVTQGTSLALAVNQLAQAVDRKGSYGPALQTVASLAGDSPETAEALAGLEAFADTGAPDMASLRAAFPGVASRVMKAISLSEGDDWMTSALARIKSLVSIRRVGEEVVGDTPEALLAQAEVALEDGDLATAVAAMDMLPEPGLEAAADWLTAARGRVAVNRAIDVLQSRAIGALSR